MINNVLLRQFRCVFYDFVNKAIGNEDNSRNLLTTC